MTGEVNRLVVWWLYRKLCRACIGVCVCVCVWNNFNRVHKI